MKPVILDIQENKLDVEINFRVPLDKLLWHEYEYANIEIRNVNFDVLSQIRKLSKKDFQTIVFVDHEKPYIINCCLVDLSSERVLLLGRIKNKTEDKCYVR